MSQSSSDNKDSEQFQIGDIVWAKVSGFPWWPGQIKKIIKPRK